MVYSYSMIVITLVAPLPKTPFLNIAWFRHHYASIHVIISFFLVNLLFNVLYIERFSKCSCSFLKGRVGVCTYLDRPAETLLATGCQRDTHGERKGRDGDGAEGWLKGVKSITLNGNCTQFEISSQTSDNKGNGCVILGTGE